MKGDAPKVIRHELYDELQQLKDHMQLMQTVQTARDNEKRKRKGLASKETAETADELSRRAVSTQVAQICLCATDIRRHHVKTWNAFCQKAAGSVEVSHSRPTPEGVAVLVINTDGRIMNIDEHWFDFFISNDALALFQMFSQLHEANILSTVNALRESDEVLVYDMGNIRCVRRMMAWECGEGKFIMHLEDTAFPAACVVQRKNEMLLIHNI